MKKMTRYGGSEASAVARHAFVLAQPGITMNIYKPTHFYIFIPGGNPVAGVTGEMHEKYVTRHAAPSRCAP
jgi:hypothetical protein